VAKGKAVAVLLAGAGLAGLVMMRRRSKRKERVDLYYADGSMVSFERGSLEASRLVPIAQEIIGAVNGGATR
jgi:hypothetical protein